ncbi:MAG: hypothetical protein ACLFVU_01110 [Phycisphaerae bacterium]
MLSLNCRSNRKNRTGGVKKWLVIVLVLAVAAFVTWWFVFRGEDAAAVEDLPVATVVRGDLPVTVIEGGQVEAKYEKVIANELSWPVNIEFVAPEGPVRAGDLVLKLRCDKLDEAIAEREERVLNAQAAYDIALDELKQQEKELENEIRKAAWQLEVAQMDMLRYEEIEYPLQVKEKEDTVRTSSAKLKLAREQYEFMIEANEKLEENSPYTSNELESERISLLSMEQSLEKAKKELLKLQKFDHPKKLQELLNAVEDGELGYQRAELKAESSLRSLKSTLRSKQVYLEKAEEELSERLTDRQENLVFKAEKDGIILHEKGRHWDPVTIEAGAEIRPHKRILIIPDTSSLQIKTSVYEALGDRVSPGIRSLVRLEQEGTTPMPGEIVHVSPMPKQKHRWLYPNVKVYEVTIELDEEVPGLKPQSTAKVELFLDRVEDTLKIPVAAVFTEQEQTYCYIVQKDNSACRVPIKVGEMNDKHVQVEIGLGEGDRVALIEPGEYETDDAQLPAIKAAIKQEEIAKAKAKEEAARERRQRSTDTQPAATQPSDQGEATVSAEARKAARESDGG